MTRAAEAWLISPMRKTILFSSRSSSIVISRVRWYVTLAEAISGSPVAKGRVGVYSVSIWMIERGAGTPRPMGKPPGRTERIGRTGVGHESWGWTLGGLCPDLSQRRGRGGRFDALKE